ncbi:matrix metalloproteinase-2-like [Stomoxys calcitrans]|uniref:matrix metalloproteinase-2-like n=1 Tax=Stomoxys calcitrans TaxID=35570 RepID=UPI0027E2F74B|nr:matrix metalloproteinase-2-like [Stomoxys calcitrans]
MKNTTSPSIHLNRNSKICLKMSFTLGVVLLMLTLQSFLVQTKPIMEYSAKHRKHHKNANLESAVSDDILYNYLMEFDYLPKSDFETGALRTEKQFKDAIRNLQRFGHIPETGELDSETKKLIKRPRCGVGDSNQTLSFSPDNLHHGRMKRYALQGPKWDKTDLTWR